MIKQETIELVRGRVDIMDVVGKDVKLRNSGASAKGCCPFHQEKTPSFHVFGKSQSYKCFGCGESGDSIAFVMKHHRLSFTEAIERLAADLNIPIEYDEVARQEAQERKDKRAEMQEVLAFAHKQYQQQLMNQPPDGPAWQYLNNRGISREMAIRWDLGFAPHDFKFLTSSLINLGRYVPAEECGVVKTKDGKSYDVLVNRIVIPVRDVNGALVTLAGRALPNHDGKETAKYLNGKDSLIYNKSKVLYGLYEAVRSRAINDMGFCYLVEGYFDVQAMHEGGALNTVAPCGTAITPEQALFLKRYTTHVVLMQDGDNAGMKSMLKAIDLFLALDFKVEVAELPSKMDPDEFIRQIGCLAASG